MHNGCKFKLSSWIEQQYGETYRSQSEFNSEVIYVNEQDSWWDTKSNSTLRIGSDERTWYGHLLYPSHFLLTIYIKGDHHLYFAPFSYIHLIYAFHLFFGVLSSTFFISILYFDHHLYFTSLSSTFSISISFPHFIYIFITTCLLFLSHLIFTYCHLFFVYPSDLPVSSNIS